MGDSKRSAAGLGALALVALVVCCAGPVLISAGVLAAIGTRLRNGLAIAIAAALVAGAVGYTLYRHRRGYLPTGSSRDPGRNKR